MVQSSKWVRRTKPDHLISRVARRALRDRLETVWDYAPLASNKWQEDIEYVHQFRVATRRARAALQIFAGLLPKRKARWMKKTLQELRRAAGEARDLDVLGDRLGKLAAEEGHPDLTVVVQQIANRRREAQERLRTAVKFAKRKGFQKRSRALVKATRWRKERTEPGFAEAARTRLRPRVREFFAAAQADLTDISALHRMRITGKQVRYAMELLAGAFDRSFRDDLYVTFEEVQEKLGVINDHATAIGTFKEWRQHTDCSASRAELDQLVATEEELLEQHCHAFRNWWTTQRVRGLAEQFEQALRPLAERPLDDVPSKNPRLEDARCTDMLISVGE